MTDEIPIGPNRCPSCWAEYGEHTETCKRRDGSFKENPLMKEVLDLRAENIRLRNHIDCIHELLRNAIAVISEEER